MLSLNLQSPNVEQSIDLIDTRTLLGTDLIESLLVVETTVDEVSPHISAVSKIVERIRQQHTGIQAFLDLQRLLQDALGLHKIALLQVDGSQIAQCQSNANIIVPNTDALGLERNEKCLQSFFIFPF